MAALSKAQLQALIERDCTQQGAVSVPGAILKELVDNYIESVATAAAGAVITEQDAIADLAAEAAVTAVVPVVNAILAALRENGIIAAA